MSGAVTLFIKPKGEQTHSDNFTHNMIIKKICPIKCQIIHRIKIQLVVETEF